MPDKLTINIVEREPIARVGASGRVVDEEGVVFIRYAGTGGLPMIKGSDMLAQVKPGDRLQGMDWAAVRLVNNTLRPDCRVRLLVVDTSKEDYLFITFFDHRQAKIAWDGMQDQEKNTERRMQRQLDNLAKAMDCEIGRPASCGTRLIPAHFRDAARRAMTKRREGVWRFPPIAALEIGTSRTVFCVGETDDNGRVRITGVGTYPSTGVRKGQITDLAQAGVGVEAAAKQAEKQADVSIWQVLLAIPARTSRPW
jgi:hypothetical protein